jgi:glycosyltransferase involved in cell wall biosynthesis
MKILYNTNAVVPSRSANSIHVMRMCQAFARNGHQVTLLVPDWKNRYELGVEDAYKYYGVEECFEIIKAAVQNLPGKVCVYASFLIHMAQRLHMIQPDLVYGRFACGCYFASVQGYSTVFESHVPMWEGHKLERVFFDRLIRKKKFKKMVVISHALKEIYIRSGYLSKAMIQVAHDAADDNTDFMPLPNWPGRKNRLQVGYVGHLYDGRGVELLLELAGEMPHLDFHLVGGTDEDLVYWQSRGRRTNIFFHGYVAPEKVYSYQNSCDVLLAPYQDRVARAGGKGDTSRYMSPLKVFEYMASKKPIVASNLPVLREVLGNNNAILVPPSDVQAWKDALSRLHNRTLRERLSRNAYHDFKEKYEWSARAKWVLDENWNCRGHDLV